MRVVATEAGGAIHVFDGNGSQLESFRPGGDYYADVMAAVMDGGETVQIVAAGEGRVVACDEAGHLAWSTPSPEDHAAWRSVSFASGDANGDGLKDWAFFGQDGALLIASSAGERLAELPGQEQVTSFAFADNALITLAGDTLTAYTFEPEIAGDGVPRPVPAIPETTGAPAHPAAQTVQ